jgi:beta-aspartyl-peptidase (threonine type)
MFIYINFKKRKNCSSGSVLDAVVAAVSVMEDDAAFNAGRGSKLTIMGHVEMDAAIMEGLNMKAGKSKK